jgi:3D (Asp-Asp-Asp) domain-containing protein
MKEKELYLVLYTVLLCTVLLTFIILVFQGGKTTEKFYTEKVIEVPVKPEYQLFSITAYTIAKTDEYQETDSGTLYYESITMACPENLDFGTKIYVPALDTVFTCQDRLDTITEGKLGVFIDNVNSFMSFGTQQLEVFILP